MLKLACRKLGQDSVEMYAQFYLQSGEEECAEKEAGPEIVFTPC